MSDFAMAQAAGDDDPAALVAACVEQLRAAGAGGHGLGFVYVTSPLAENFAEVVGALREGTGIATWVGTAGLGVCATGVEHFGAPAIVALTCRMDASAHRVLPAVGDVREVGSAAARFPAGIGIVHGDPRNGDVGEIVESLAQRHGAWLVGGLTSAEAAFPQVAGAEVVDGGVSGVLLGARGLEATVGLTQGCSPVGDPHAVTEADGQVIATLGDKPALEVLRAAAGAGPADDPRVWLAGMHAAILVPGSRDADYVVRNIVGIDVARGLVAIADVVSPGDRVMLVRRDRAAAERDLDRMLADVRARSVRPPRAGLYFSCLARGPNLFAVPGHEMRAIGRVLGDIPVVGFFGNGEIAGGRVYGYTGVLLALG